MYRGNALVNQQNPKTVYSADTLPQIQFQVHEFIINKQCNRSSQEHGTIISNHEHYKQTTNTVFWLHLSMAENKNQVQ